MRRLKRGLKRRKLDVISLLVALLTIGAGLLWAEPYFKGSSNPSPTNGADIPQ
jgi:hypothetical protein